MFEWTDFTAMLSDSKVQNHLFTVNTVKHVFFACTKFSRISRVGKNREIKYLWKFSSPIKDLVNTSRTPGKRQIKMQRNFYISKSRKMQQKYNVLQYLPEISSSRSYVYAYYLTMLQLCSECPPNACMLSSRKCHWLMDASFSAVQNV